MIIHQSFNNILQQNISQIKIILKRMKTAKNHSPRLIQHLKAYSVKLQFVQESRNNKKINQFVPFVRQRKLGKLIVKNDNKKQQKGLMSQKDILEKVNFRNFKKYYNKQKKIYEQECTSKTRIPSQKNLLRNQEWQVNGLNRYHSSLNKFNLGQKQLHIFASTSRIQLLGNQTKNIKNTLVRQCCQKKSINLDKINKKINNFEKIDEHLYKKINLYRPPSQENPQLNLLFEHFASSCQLNQNIRRKMITTRPKKTIILRV